MLMKVILLLDLKGKRWVKVKNGRKSAAGILEIFFL